MIAVLPFENLSDEPLESDHIASGLSRILIDRLTAVGLRVRQWTSVQQYAERGNQPSFVSLDMGTDAVLAGTFRMVDEAILVDLKLYVDNGFQLVWSQRFEGSYENLVAFQQQLVFASAERLKGRLGDEDRDRLEDEVSSSVDAYDAYLSGVHIFRATDEGAASDALDWFQRAVALDPDLA